MQTGEVLCGVCGRGHEVPLVTGEYRCATQGRRYALWFGTVRSLATTADENHGSRHLRLAAVHDDEELVWEWDTDFGNEVLADANDEFAIATRRGRVTAFHNLTLDRVHVFSTCWPPKMVGLLCGLAIFLVALVWLLV